MTILIQIALIAVAVVMAVVCITGWGYGGEK